MAGVPEITIMASSILDGCTIRIKVKGVRIFKIRMNLAMAIFRIGAVVAGAESEISMDLVPGTKDKKP